MAIIKKRISETTFIGTPKGFNPKSNEDGLVAFLNMSAIDEKFGLYSKPEYISKEEIKSGFTKFGCNAVLLAKITPCTQNNKTALITEPYGGFATTEVFSIHPSKELLPKYLLHYLRSPSVRSILVASMYGATGRQRIPVDSVKNLEIPVPPLTEQKRIVKKLDALFERIDKAIALCEENMQHTEALMAAVLNDELGRVRKGFKARVVGSYLEDIKTGTTPSRREEKYFKGGAFDWYSPSDFTGVTFLKNSKNKITEVALAEGKAKLFTSGTLLLVGIGATIGKVGLLQKAASTNQQITGLKFTKTVNPEYAFYWFVWIKEKIIQNSSSATLPIINQKGIKNLPIVVPPLAMQMQLVNKFANVKLKTRSLMQELQVEINTLAALKSSITDRAFKGEL